MVPASLAVWAVGQLGVRHSTAVSTQLRMALMPQCGKLATVERHYEEHSEKEAYMLMHSTCTMCMA